MWNSYFWGEYFWLPSFSHSCFERGSRTLTSFPGLSLKRRLLAHHSLVPVNQRLTARSGSPGCQAPAGDSVALPLRTWERKAEGALA